MTVHSRSLHMMAVDVAVMGLQKWPISAIVLRVGILELPGLGMLTIETERKSNILVLGSETGSVVLGTGFWFCGLGAVSVRLGLWTETGNSRARKFEQS